MFGIRDYYRGGDRPHYQAPLWTTYKQIDSYAPGYEEKPRKRAPESEHDLVSNADAKTVHDNVEHNRPPYNLTTPTDTTVNSSYPRADVQRLTTENDKLKTDNDKLKTENSELQVQIDSLKKALADKMNDFNQERSDFQSYRARMTDVESKAVINGKIKLFTALLPVIDDLERIESNEDLPVTVTRALEKLKTTLAFNGAVEYGEKGDEFDPNKHNAVLLTGDSNSDHKLVSEVVSHGWTMDDRLVRPAQVVVTGGDNNGGE